MKKRSAFTACLAALLAWVPVHAQEPRTIRFGHLNNPDHPISLGVKRFAELVAARSGGKLVVQEFPASALGNELQQQSALQGGIQEMTAPAPSSLAGIVKEFGLLDFPFVVSTPQQADALTDGQVGKLLFAKLPEKGLVGLAFWDLGFRNVTNSKRPIARVEDFEGLKLRVIPNPVFLETFKTFKANPVPMPFAELYSALETRAVDGQENPFAVILSNKIFEVQKFLSVTNHVYTANTILVSKVFWDRCSPAEQKLLQEAALEARDYERKLSREAAQKALGELKAKGMQVNEVAPAEIARMREMVRPVYDKFTAAYDPAVVKAFRAELDRIRAQN
ncbi:MAG TPA: TRAP transporter substrate-binding protein [Burkholderiales bacterium]|nr:TRAP transporter substrate-binding protein [Burkholderiales bacterium]